MIKILLDDFIRMFPDASRGTKAELHFKLHGLDNGDLKLLLKGASLEKMLKEKTERD